MIKQTNVKFLIKYIKMYSVSTNKQAQKQQPQCSPNQQQTQNNIHTNLNKSPPKTAQCRICLSNNNMEYENDAKMISPCKCAGSLKYVHEECLQSWISKIVNSTDKKLRTGKSHIYCQLCKTKIYFRTRKQLKCKTKQQIIDHFKQNIKTFVLLMLLLLINLGFFSALLNYLLFVGFVSMHQSNVVLVSLTISGQVIFSIVSVVTLVCIVNKYFLNREFVVYEIVDHNITQPTQINQDKIISMVKDIGGD